MMTFNDMLDQGVEFQSEVRLCYYDYRKGDRVMANESTDSRLYNTLANQEIRYIYTDKEIGESTEQAIYIEVSNPFEEEE